MSPEEQVERAVRRHLTYAEYRFDVAIASLLDAPRPESPGERRVREMREGFAEIGLALGRLARTAALAAQALVDAFRAGVEVFTAALEAERAKTERARRLSHRQLRAQIPLHDLRPLRLVHQQGANLEQHGLATW